jgi:hypothetical protein
MVPVSFAHGWRAVRSAGASAFLVIALVTPALAAEPAEDDPAAGVGMASMSEPWVATELPDAEALASGHGRYVAVGSGGIPAQAAAWTSADGLTWEEAIVSDAPAGSAMTDVVSTDDGFVAFGVESGMFDGSGERFHAWFSADGLEWQESTMRAAAKSPLQVIPRGLANGPAGQLALGSFVGQDLGAQRLWRTTDGLVWERAKLPQANGRIWTGIVQVPQGYLLLGQSLPGEPYNWRSADGIDWRRSKGMPLLFDVAASDTGALVGMGYKDLYRSPRSLRTWEKVQTRPKAWNVDGANAFEWVSWDGSEFVVPGRDFSTCSPASDECHRNPLLVSVDGTTWSESAGPDGLPGADDAAWMLDVASLDGSTVLLGDDHGTRTAWTTGEVASE